MGSSTNKENKNINLVFKRRYLLSKLSFFSSDFEKEFLAQKNYLLNMGSKLTNLSDTDKLGNFRKREQILQLLLKRKKAKRLFFLNSAKKFVILCYWLGNNFFFLIFFTILILFFKGYFKIIVFSSLDFIKLPFWL